MAIRVMTREARERLVRRTLNRERTGSRQGADRKRCGRGEKRDLSGG